MHGDVWCDALVIAIFDQIARLLIALVQRLEVCRCIAEPRMNYSSQGGKGGVRLRWGQGSLKLRVEGCVLGHTY